MMPVGPPWTVSLWASRSPGVAAGMIVVVGLAICWGLGARVIAGDRQAELGRDRRRRQSSKPNAC